jgi:hypothetical protein
MDWTKQASLRDYSMATRRAASLISMGLILNGLAVSLFLPCLAKGQLAPPTTFVVTIVLPPRIVAGRPATLAVLGVDGRLAPGMEVALGDGQRIKTDNTGRSLFAVPSSGDVLFVRASGASTVALVDAVAPPDDPHGTIVAPIVSMRDRFSICGAGLRSDADANRVRIDGEPALVLAASPECLVVLPGPKTPPGPAQISVETPNTQWTAATTLVSLQFDTPKPPWAPSRKGQLDVHVLGTEDRLDIIVENATPGVLKFTKGDRQEVRTSGGPHNSASIKIETIRSGDFSFHARLAPAPDVAASQRYIRAAASLAPKDLEHEVEKLVSELSHHPHNLEKVRRRLDEILSVTISSDFRTLLASARNAL